MSSWPQERFCGKGSSRCAKALVFHLTPELKEDCSGSEWFFGTTGPWRIYDQYSCWSGRREAHRCQQSDGMGGWFEFG
jgi:hypothetical protein